MYFTKEKGYFLDDSGAGAVFDYKLDASQQPNHLDLVLDTTAVRGNVSKLNGLMELKGDSLKVAFNDGSGGPRPESLEIKEGSKSILLVLQRDKDAKEPDPKAGAEKIKQAAARANSTNNLKQMGLAMHNYMDVNKSFPAHAVYSKDGKPLLSWRVMILPYIEQDALYRQFKLDEPWDSDHNKKLMAQMPKIYGRRGPRRFIASLQARTRCSPDRRASGSPTSPTGRATRS